MRIVTFQKYCTVLLLVGSSWVATGQPLAEKAIDISPVLIGEKAPDLILKTTGNTDEKLLDLLGEKPTVLIFYRGGWCPYCNTHMAELQRIESDIIRLGYQIIAISPDSPDNLQASMDKHKLNYKLLSDADMKAANAFGIAFTVSPASKERLNKASAGINPGQLPVPSVFVLNKQGEILFEYINPEYKKRLSSNLLIAVLNVLSEN